MILHLGLGRDFCPMKLVTNAMLTAVVSSTMLHIWLGFLDWSCLNSMLVIYTDDIYDFHNCSLSFTSIWRWRVKIFFDCQHPFGLSGLENDIPMNLLEPKGQGCQAGSGKKRERPACEDRALCWWSLAIKVPCAHGRKSLTCWSRASDSGWRPLNDDRGKCRWQASPMSSSFTLGGLTLQQRMGCRKGMSYDVLSTCCWSVD
jgi:hypothetical protein